MSKKPVYHVPDMLSGAPFGWIVVSVPSAEFIEIVIVPEGDVNTWVAMLVLFVGSERPKGFVLFFSVSEDCGVMEADVPDGGVFVATVFEF